VTMAPPPSLRLVDDELVAHLEAHPDERSEWVFLEPHSDFPGFWRVESFNRGLYFDLGEEIGPYRALAPARLERFRETCSKAGYRIAFFEDPTTILSEYEGLNEVPPISLNSDLPGTVHGMLPYQVQGFNFLKDKSGVAMWSTGTGKTVLASSLIKHHLERKSFDLCWFVVKSHNKVNTQRTLDRVASLDSLVVKGSKKSRHALYAGLADIDSPVTLVTNYEKFRTDHDSILPLFDQYRMLIIWDEMPTKLKNRTSQLYTAVCECLYSTNAPQVRADRVRPPGLIQYMLSATPIENDPEDWFNCIRLIDPTVYGTVKGFRDEYVARYSYFDDNKPEAWHKLDKMGMKAAHVVHQVDKEDPDIAAQFPGVIDEPYYIDWDEADRKVYDRFTKELAKELDDELSVVQGIGLMQMLCDSFTMVTDSAARREVYEQTVAEWFEEGAAGEAPPAQGSAAALRLIEALEGKLTDERHTKLETLRQLITEDHRGERIVVFSQYNDGLLPILESKFRSWGIQHVRYGGSEGARQAALDRWGNDDSVTVFLSSDAGSDSINLQQASVVIHYDIPWKWSTLIQRQNRVHRITSTFSQVRYYTLMMADSIEDRKMKVVQRKQGYHEGVFKGAIAGQSASARMTKDDLLYILRG
jgi:SNF2 family DNA or RNA helicase